MKEESREICPNIRGQEREARVRGTRRREKGRGQRVREGRCRGRGKDKNGEEQEGGERVQGEMRWRRG